MTVPQNNQPVMNGSSFSKVWYDFFFGVAKLLSGPIDSANVPATSTSAGVEGQSAQDGNYLYICVATNTWKRIALTAF